MRHKPVIFIPARFASTRFPGKPLVMLKGANGQAKSLLQRSWEAAKAVVGVDGVFILTEDERIRAAADEFGATTLMTSDACRNGTERCAEALAQLDTPPDVVVNLQGDAPLTPSRYVEALINAMSEADAPQVATPALKTTGAHLNLLKKDRREGRVGGTTAVFDQSGHALYFSKEVIPYTSDYGDEDETPVFHHVGVYAYTPDALKRYMQSDPGPLETLEGLEQLRFLENGVPVRCIRVDGKTNSFWEVNNPCDVEMVEAILQREGIA
ncbi:3-deoxy-manno-octulosonate cytidylyltransferase [Aliiroseovarius sp. YM-037]|uniref:3-deoxy-manno-octulosonate cytidylyltransferase n=1 Tax=Aliiroseovarius sp. YM-037 TaxID=3341728 RepID=UPI003A80E3E6